MIVQNQNPEWLQAEDWRFVQETVPITCVDVLPIRWAGNSHPQFGLILRETPRQGQRWCLIGGRLLRHELVKDAISRQLIESLGNGVMFELQADPQPVYMAQYFTSPRPGAGWDPRQHAIGLVFAVGISGHQQPSGEALDFALFPADSPPSPNLVGFNQHPILLECLRRLGTRGTDC